MAEVEKVQLVHQNMSVAQLVERALLRKEGVLTAEGALSVRTGKYTGRSPEDRYVVCDSEVEDRIDWGNVNRPISEEAFERLHKKVLSYLEEQEEIYEFRGYVGADAEHRLPIRVVNEFAWQNLFAHQLFIRPSKEELALYKEEFTVLSAPSCLADPREDGTNSEAFVVISFAKRMVIIGGTHYAGEIKKSLFSVMNYLLPQKGILSMHCSANVDFEGNSALFFGLSGTGKTTLSADPSRQLVGDDEHGWTEAGIFNFEGGCYAKCINLSHEKEPQIFEAVRFGAVVENVVLNEWRVPQYDDESLTENTRCAYPLHYIPNALPLSQAGHPKTIIFLTADAFGVLPPISVLDANQAMYHFLSGYTSKLAGTERGILSPQTTFSTCFGSPFLPLQPAVYAQLLGEFLEKHSAKVFLVNTGWTGGPYGVGKRMPIPYTRAMVDAALQGRLDEVPLRHDGIFNLQVPTTCPRVPQEVLDPRLTWEDKEAYQRKAIELALAFQKNFKRFSAVPDAIRSSGPIS